MCRAIVSSLVSAERMSVRDLLQRMDDGID